MFYCSLFMEIYVACVTISSYDHIIIFIVNIWNSQMRQAPEDEQSVGTAISIGYSFPEKGSKCNLYDEQDNKSLRRQSAIYHVSVITLFCLHRSFRSNLRDDLSRDMSFCLNKFRYRFMLVQNLCVHMSPNTKRFPYFDDQLLCKNRRLFLEILLNEFSKRIAMLFALIYMSLCFINVCSFFWRLK